MKKRILAASETELRGNGRTKQASSSRQVKRAMEKKEGAATSHNVTPNKLGARRSNKRGCNVVITKIRSIQPKTLSKSIRLKNGKINTIGGGQVYRGTTERIELRGPDEFAELLMSLTPDQALCYGTTFYPKAELRTAEELGDKSENEDGLPIIARTREHFSFIAEAGILMLDIDLPDGQSLSSKKLKADLVHEFPWLANGPVVWSWSSSSYIYRGERQVRGERGRRVYIFVQDASDIPRAGQVLVNRLWLAGYGYFKVSKSGHLLARTLVDGAVFQPERLDFAAGARCELPLVQKRRKPKVFNPDAEYFDTRELLPDLTAEEEGRLRVLHKREKDKKIDASRVAREKWQEKRQQEFVKKYPDEDASIYREQCLRALESGHLYGKFVLYSVEHGAVTVEDVLAEPSKFNGTRFADPIEPDYHNDRRIAYANINDDGTGTIYSHAHGGRLYKLNAVLQIIKIRREEAHRDVKQLLAALKEDGTVYNFGGELCYTAGNTLHPVTPEWLQLHLMQLLLFEKYALSKNIWFRTDCPRSYAVFVLSQRGNWGVPELRGVINAPTLREDWSILDQEGFDDATGLLLRYDDPSRKVVVPQEPTLGEVRRAVDALWFPFRKFPFCSAVDRAVFLSALFTATIRVLLPTAPGIGFDAPTKASGKTKLAQTIGIMTSGMIPGPLVIDSSDSEMRKRLFALLREGQKTVFIDNLKEPLDSDALCVFLTSPSFSDRILGKSATQTLLNLAMVLLTGNNLEVKGDLTRRVQRCRIDPRIEHPYLRKFRFDPVRWVIDHRMKLIRAALTILRGFHVHAELQPISLGSFEQWSDRVRQPVIWVGEQGWLDVGDPVDAIQQATAEDDDTILLGAVLEHWYGLMGKDQMTVGQLVAALSGSYINAPKKGQHANKLRPFLDSIAGDNAGINTRKLGQWLKAHQDRIVKGKRLEIASRASGQIHWSVIKINDKG